MNAETASEHRNNNKSSQTIIVTGASAGIGLSISKYLLSQPQQHLLVLVSRRVDETENLRGQYGERVLVVQADMSDASQIANVIQSSKQHFGERIDALVLNHGTLGKCQRIEDSGLKDWEEIFRINLFGNVELIKDAIPLLRQSRGRIIFTSSGAALNAYSSWGAYGASKAAVNHLTMTLKNEEPEITTIAIRPGVVDTEMQTDIREKYLQNMDESDREKFTSAKKNNKLLPAERPGNVIAKLAVHATKDLSGRFLSWDDGSLKNYQD